jgi:glyoxylase-like metal-dependent hydrolase (beta-lactamase superfamily II)
LTGPGQAGEQDLLAQAAAAGIHRLAIPTPFQVGRVNAYLIEDSPLTLIDSGPNSGKALDELERALAARGHAIEDIELLIVTHQHIDHIGLASIVARRSGAQVAGLERLAPYLLRFREEAELDDRFAQDIMLRNGIPADVVTALRAVSASFRAWGATVEITRPLRDGETIELRDRTLTVLHRPGHSPSDTIFLDRRPGRDQGPILLAGDHLIKHISSNPLLARPLGGGGIDADRPGSSVEGERPRALLQYIASLRLTREMQLALVLPGHGEPIVDHAALIDERLRMHRRRAEKIHGLITAEARSAHEIALELWGNVAVTQAFLTLSEVLGHVDLLIEEGRAVERSADGAGVVRFEAA